MEARSYSTDNTFSLYCTLKNEPSPVCLPLVLASWLARADAREWITVCLSAITPPLIRSRTALRELATEI
jgi:hypothetical protein